MTFYRFCHKDHHTCARRDCTDDFCFETAPKPLTKERSMPPTPGPRGTPEAGGIVHNIRVKPVWAPIEPWVPSLCQWCKNPTFKCTCDIYG